MSADASADENLPTCPADEKVALISRQRQPEDRRQHIEREPILFLDFFHQRVNNVCSLNKKHFDAADMICIITRSVATENRVCLYLCVCVPMVLRFPTQSVDM
jgi:hypothetical protein